MSVTEEHASENTGADAAPTPFHDLQDYVSLPRVTGLTLSPDGSRLVTSVSGLDTDRTRYVTALWDVDPAGARPARRLTRSAQGERTPAFTPNGDLLFASARPDPAQRPKDPTPVALWLLPCGGGEARVVGSRPGGIGSPVVATEAGTVVITSMTLPGVVTSEEDEQRRTARADKKISAILHSGHPVRFWDHDLGPDQPRLFAGALPAGEGTVDWTDLTPVPGMALRETSVDISPDGQTIVTNWLVAEPYGSSRPTLAAIDVTSGERRALADHAGYEFGTARISPDGRSVAAIRTNRSKPADAPRVELVVMPLTGGEPLVPAVGWDRWPAELRWTPDATALIVAADENGRSPLFRITVAEGTVTRLTGDDGAYTDPLVSPDGGHVYALRAAVDAPAVPVRIGAHDADQQPVLLPGPVEAPATLPGTLAEVTTTADDGTALRAWLALPAHAADEPAPLLLWIHGGPLGSWNTWSWRWNPWLMVARGYAVLLPDPALSTGYGQSFIDRGWGAWGGPPYTDVLTLTDAAEALPEIDATRTAAMGGSFGGYLANWLAGHTDRFAAIVTHASIWTLDQASHTTDETVHLLREMTAEMRAAHSPHSLGHAITTPMLVIHGDRDYRVPIGEALRLWWDLVSGRPDPDDQPHRFLYFPDENHWILQPQHAVIWYETVTAFLAHHVLGKEFHVPDLLR